MQNNGKNDKIINAKTKIDQRDGSGDIYLKADAYMFNECCHNVTNRRYVWHKE